MTIFSYFNLQVYSCCHINMNPTLNYGLGMNITNETNFSCTASELSSSNVTDPVTWTLREEIANGNIPIAIIQIVFFLIGFSWNLFIVVTYIIKRHLLKEPANFFLFNLAIIDMLTCALLLPVNFIALAANDYIFGSTDSVRCGVCFANGFLVACLVLFSLHALALLSIDRFLLLSFPLWYKKRMSLVVSIITVVAVTVTCVVISILPAFGFGEWEFNRNFGTCLPRWTGTRNGIKNIYYMGLIIVEAAIPVIVLAVTNIWTYKVVTRFLKSRHRRRSIFKNKKEENKKLKREQLQLVRVFGALFIANVISWTPVFLVFVIVFILSNFQKQDLVPSYVFTIGWLCFLSSSVIHPIIESFFIKELRYQVRRAQRSVRAASRTLIRAATATLSEIPEDVSVGDATPKTRHNFSLSRKSTNMSLNTTNMTDLNESPNDSPVGYRSPKMSSLATHQNGVIIAATLPAEILQNGSPTSAGDTIIEMNSSPLSTIIEMENRNSLNLTEMSSSKLPGSPSKCNGSLIGSPSKNSSVFNPQLTRVQDIREQTRILAYDGSPLVVKSNRRTQSSVTTSPKKVSIVLPDSPTGSLDTDKQDSRLLQHQSTTHSDNRNSVHSNSSSSSDSHEEVTKV